MSSWTVLISEACTRHACGPLFENLPAWRRRGGKFRVFSPFFGKISGFWAAFQPSADTSLCGGVRGRRQVVARAGRRRAAVAGPGRLLRGVPVCRGGLSVRAGGRGRVVRLCRSVVVGWV